MFEYKSGGYTRQLQRAFIVIAVAIALCVGLGPGLAEILKARSHEFSNRY